MGWRENRKGTHRRMGGSGGEGRQRGHRGLGLSRSCLWNRRAASMSVQHRPPADPLTCLVTEELHPYQFFLQDPVDNPILKMALRL